MANTSLVDEIERAKHNNLGQLLLRAARLYNETCVARVQEFYPGFTVAHTTLFPHLEFHRGVRPTELAQRLGTSKQAVNQLLNDLERMGTIERIPDPSDGRAKLIVFTQEGKGAVLTGLAVLKQLEQELTERLSPETVSQLKGGLAGLLKVLEDQ